MQHTSKVHFLGFKYPPQLVQYRSCAPLCFLLSQKGCSALASLISTCRAHVGVTHTCAAPVMQCQVSSRAGCLQRTTPAAVWQPQRAPAGAGRRHVRCNMHGSPVLSRLKSSARRPDMPQSHGLCKRWRDGGGVERQRECSDSAFFGAR